MHKHFLLSAFLLSLCLGCGTGEYESRIGQHHGGGGGGAAAAPSTDLGPAEDLPGTRVSVRVPGCLMPLPDGTDPKRDQLLHLQPAYVERAYEGFVKDSTGGQIPFYCHIFAAETPKTPGPGVADRLFSTLTTGGGGVRGSPGRLEWQVTGPDGKQRTWDAMKLSGGQMQFYYKDKSGQPSYRYMDNSYLFVWCDESGYSVAIAYRLPTEIEKNVGEVGLSELGKATAAGVTFRPK